MNDTERLDFMCNANHMRKIECCNGLWRVYEDMNPVEFPEAAWRSMTSQFYTSSREAIDAAYASKVSA